MIHLTFPANFLLTYTLLVSGWNKKSIQVANITGYGRYLECSFLWGGGQGPGLADLSSSVCAAAILAQVWTLSLGGG